MFKVIDKKLNLNLIKCHSNCVNASLNQLKRFSSEGDSSSWFTTEAVDQTEARVVPKPVGYLPEHLGFNRARLRQKPWWKFRHFINVNQLDDQSQEWAQTPQYPHISDVSKEGIKKRIRLEWYEAIKRLATAQEKEYEMAKHFKHLTFLLESVSKQYNCLPLQQFITRTHLISRQLPSLYDDINVDHILTEDLKQSIVDEVVLHLFHTKQRKPIMEFRNTSIPLMGFPTDQLRVITAQEEDLIEGVVQILRKSLVKDNTHLEKVQLDMSPSVCSSWWVSGYPIPFKSGRFAGETIDQVFTYKATNALHMRTENPLPQILALDHDICTKSEIPEYKNDLLKQGFAMRRHNFSTIPGFWSDHSNGFDFPYLICHSRKDMKLREMVNERSFADNQQVLDGMAITSSFAWLHAMASNLGFSAYHELTYPLVNQVITTDGQFWSFHVYQLNTHAFHSDVDTHQLRNVCWSSGDLKLFETYENGQLKGLNEQVLKLLVKFLSREPEIANNIELRPYLSNDSRSAADIEHLGYTLRRKYSNYTDKFVATRNKVHLWEKIYRYHKEASPTVHLRQRPKMKFKYPPFFTR